MNTSKLIDYLSKRFALKIARGYSIFVDDRPVRKPTTFDSRNQPVLFRLDNGIEVYGNLTNIDKPRNENIDILIDQVYIESLAFEWKVEGWVNCDELELTSSREGISTDENTVYSRTQHQWSIKNYLLFSVPNPWVLPTLKWHVPLIDCPRCGKADGRAQKPRKQGDMYINHGSGSYNTSCHLNPLQTVSLLSYIIVSQSQKLEESDKTVAELGKKLRS
jgi:hypothetical protein